MSRTWLLLSLMTLTSPSVWAAEPVGAPSKPARSVLIVKFLGLPPDSVQRREMLAGFREEMSASSLRCERRIGSEWAPADSVPNTFQLMDAAPEGEAWMLELSVRVPQPVRANVLMQQGTKKEESQLIRSRLSTISSSRGMVVAATASPPLLNGRRADYEPVPVVVSLYFADARRVVVPSPNLPGGGYAYPWIEAGRAVARTAIEALLRTSGALEAERRAALAPATRVAEAETP